MGTETDNVLQLSKGFRIARNSPLFSESKMGTCLFHTSFYADMHEKLKPMADASGLYEISKPIVKKIFLSLELVEPPCKKLVPDIKYLSADKCLLVIKKFIPDEWPDDDYLDWKNFSETHYAELIDYAARKYAVGAGHTKQNQTSLIKDTLDQHEIHINIPLSDQTFGTMEDNISNLELMNKIEVKLSETGKLKVTGCEIGLGFFTIFCVGKSPKKMKDNLLSFLQKENVSVGSFLTILEDGKEERRQII